MNSTQEWLMPDFDSAARCSSTSKPSDDSRLIEALREYLNNLEAGEEPDPGELRARHPELAPVLEDCMEGLQWVRALAPGLQPSHTESSHLPWERPTGQRLGDFQIVREIGRGGMGVVYEAHQLSLSRRVALKVLPFAASLDARQLQRFKNEAQAAANLHHTNIVPIFGVGSAQGVHYYAMQFIEGQTLAALIHECCKLAGSGNKKKVRLLTERLSRGAKTLAMGMADEDPATVPTLTSTAEPATVMESLTSAKGSPSDRFLHSPAYFRRIAELGKQATEGLEHAHQMGVIHRDIKPANLLIDTRGILWITDFGLAHIRNSSSLTITGDLMGTLRYMSPEQAMARRGLIDHRTDIYSLGVTLYELVCLEPVFGSHDRQELLRQIAFEEPLAPRKINRDVPHELETIILKAIEKNVNDRYGSAQDMADDLRRFLEDKPILAKRPTIANRVGKWARRHRSVVMTVLIIGCMSFLGMAGVLYVAYQQQVRADEQERIAKQQQQIALRESQEKEMMAWSGRNDREMRYVNHHRMRDVVTHLLMPLEKKRPEGPRVDINDIKREMAEEVVKYFEEITAEERNNPKLRDDPKAKDDPNAKLEMSFAYMLLANVCRVQGQADKANKNYTLAIGQLEELHKQYPGEFNYEQQLAFAYHSRGVHLDSCESYEAAAQDFTKAVDHYEKSTWCPLGLDRIPSVGLNNYAWFLVTCPQLKFRNPQKAEELARKLVEAAPQWECVHNTLGVAYYRNRKWKEAIVELEKSIEVRKGGDGFDWIFLAMAYCQLGHWEKGQEYYKQTLDNIEKTNLYMEPLAPFIQEAKGIFDAQIKPSRSKEQTTISDSMSKCTRTEISTKG